MSGGDGTPTLPRLSPLGAAPIPARARGGPAETAAAVAESSRDERAEAEETSDLRRPASPPADQSKPRAQPEYHRQSYRLPVVEGPRLLDRIAADAGGSRKLDRVDVMTAILMGIHRSQISFEGVSGVAGIAGYIEACLRAGARSQPQ